MTQKRIILISGKARSGKDTVRYFLKRYLYEAKGIKQNKIKTIRFADTLKNGLAKMLNTDRKTLDRYKEEKKPYKNIDIRKALQDVGSQLRDQNSDIFAFNAIEDVAKIKEDKIIFIPDLRYPNEVEVFHHSKYKDEYYVIKITRPEIDEESKISKVYQHHSETSMDSIKPDIEIVNDGTLEELEKKVKDIADDIFGGIDNG